MTSVDDRGRRSASAAFACDALVVSVGLAPRDGLLRMAGRSPRPRPATRPCRGARSRRPRPRAARSRAARIRAPGPPSTPPLGDAGYVCLCEDVGASELAAAWAEGWRSSEILKRYTTATMGPCQGGSVRRPARAVRRLERRPALGALVADHGAPARAAGPAGGRLIGGVDEVVEKRTALHERISQPMRASSDPAAGCGRPATATRQAEYAAVRERCRPSWTSARSGSSWSAGPDAAATRRRASSRAASTIWIPGRSRYVAGPRRGRLRDGRRPGLRDRRRSVLRDVDLGRRRTRWRRGSATGPTVVRWPPTSSIARARSGRSSSRARPPGISWTRSPTEGSGRCRHMSHAELTVAGVPCPRDPESASSASSAFELHHPASRSESLWEGAPFAARFSAGIRPFGLDALDVLRLEKGHLYLGQDTLPDDHPDKLGLGFAVASGKPSFLGKAALERMRERPLERKLVGLRFDGTPAAWMRRTRSTEVVGRSPRAPVRRPRREDRPRMAPRRRLASSPIVAPLRRHVTATVGPAALLRPRRGRGSVAELRSGAVRSSRLHAEPSSLRRACWRSAVHSAWRPTRSMMTGGRRRRRARRHVTEAVAHTAPWSRRLPTDGRPGRSAASGARLAFSCLSALVLPAEGFVQGDVLRPPRARSPRATTRFTSWCRPMLGDEMRRRIAATLPGTLHSRLRPHERSLSEKLAPATGGVHPRYDVVIVGGGVNGLALAYDLAARHGIRDVAVLERSYIGAGASGRNTQVVRANYNTAENVPLYKASLAIWRTLSQSSTSTSSSPPRASSTSCTPSTRWRLSATSRC